MTTKIGSMYPKKALEGCELTEDEAIREVFEAERELREGKALRGDLREILRRFRNKSSTDNNQQ